MIAADLIAKIKSQVAADIEAHQDGPNRLVVSLPLRYQDGDHCEFAFVRDAENRWHITDEGDVIIRAGYTGVDLLKKGRVEKLRNTVEFYGLTEREGELIMPVAENEFGDAVFEFSQACLDIANLARLPAERAKTDASTGKFKSSVRTLINDVVPPDRVERNWNHPVFDASGIYPVDFRVAVSDEWFIFAVSGALHCLHSAVTCLHYQNARIRFNSLAIYHDKNSFTPQVKAPLDDAAQQTFSLATEKEELVEFLREKVAA